MKPFEHLYRLARPLLLPLHLRVYQELKKLIRSSEKRPLVLDVGGRKSHYTVGIDADIVLSDLPRESEVQNALHLGLAAEMIVELERRRSNVVDIVLDDMTRTKFEPDSFDQVVAVEVLEHVEEDEAFVAAVSRVLRAGGTFLMTTPNGDFVANSNPDHKRHYRRAELQELLARHFSEVKVEYAIAGGLSRRWGLQSWSPRHPVRTLRSMAANVVNRILGSRRGIEATARGTYHLMAYARHAELDPRS